MQVAGDSPGASDSPVALVARNLCCRKFSATQNSVPPGIQSKTGVQYATGVQFATAAQAAIVTGETITAKPFFDPGISLDHDARPAKTSLTSL